jgi:glycosyltransferase involved in cell wall biosynthesis
LPRHDEYAYRDDVLRAEEEEFALADYLLCPSEFVAKTFLERGFRRERLLLHQYGFDQQKFVPGQHERCQTGDRTGLMMLFAGDCSVRKGLHFALEAWLESSACRTGKFRIAGRFLPEYERKLVPLLRDPSVEVLGFRSDLPRLMQESDLFVLPSLEEGSALVTSEARGAGCVLLVSDASGARCTHGLDGLVHPIGDVATLAQQLSSLQQDRDLLRRLRAASLSTSSELTWDAAAIRLAKIYREVAPM